ncbi:MAG: hypothetical protein WBN44_09635 [Woeseiaceae bacterium]
MSFFQELKRRNVFRVAVAYIIVGWLVLQVGDTLVPALHLPQWFNSGIALLLILGFPIAVLFAWAFELTPEGVKLERNVDRSASITDRTGQKLNLSIIVLLSLAVGYFAVDKFVLAPQRSLAESAGSAASAPSETSIAVLPFVNMSDDASNEFFADGITEELLNLLAKIPELDVTSRSSAFQFKGKDIDIPTVAAKLNVAHVLEGSVRKAGIKVRITAQLIQADSDKHVWSETYDRDLNDIFAIQDEIAREVVDVLQLTLLGAAPTSQAIDTEAYSLYLEGLHYLDRDRADDWPKAEQLFSKALQIVPDYSPALLGKARALREQANFGSINLREGTEEARSLAIRAAEMDPSSAEAWAMLGWLKYVYDWDWPGARELGEKALQLESNNILALRLMTYIEQSAGRLDSAERYGLRALQHDPLGQVTIGDVAAMYWFKGDFENSMRLTRRGMELNPNVSGYREWLSQLYTLLGRHDEAMRELQAVKVEARENALHAAYAAALLYHDVGRQDEAAAAVQYIIDNYGAPLSYQIAQRLAYQGRVDEAFEWLDIGFEDRDGGMTYLVVDPLLKNLHGDSRWRELLKRMRMLDYWDEYQQQRA